MKILEENQDDMVKSIFLNYLKIILLKEKFFMIKDQINFNSNLNVLKMKCFLCKSPVHLINECQFLHFYRDREKIIKTNEFSQNQQRSKPFLFRKKKKTKFFFTKSEETRKKFLHLLSQKLESSHILSSNEIESEKSDASLEILAEEKFQSENDKFQSENKIKMSESNLVFSSNIFPNEPKSLVKAVSRQEINSLVKTNEDGFDKICQFKIYFFHNNFSKFKISSERHMRINRKKRIKLQKISQYTFYFDSLYQKMKEKYKSKFPINNQGTTPLEKNHLLDEKSQDQTIMSPSISNNKQMKWDIIREKSSAMDTKYKEKTSFLGIVSVILKMNRERKQKRNWKFLMRKFREKINKILKKFLKKFCFK